MQLLREEEIRAVLVALASRGSSSRARSNNHLHSSEWEESPLRTPSGSLAGRYRPLARGRRVWSPLRVRLRLAGACGLEGPP